MEPFDFSAVTQAVVDFVVNLLAVVTADVLMSVYQQMLADWPTWMSNAAKSQLRLLGNEI